MSTTSFPAALVRLAADAPDAAAVICAGEELSRSDLDRASNQLARVYADHGVGIGDLVTISLPNGFDWFIACMAAWKIGAVPNPVPPTLPPSEREAVVDRADPRLTVGFASVEGLEAPGRVNLPGPGLPHLQHSDEPLPDVTSPIERALTSGGSTGTPKVICSQASAALDPSSPLGMFEARRSALVPGPLYHGIPFSSAWRSLLTGATVVVLPRFDPSACLELIERHRVDRVCFVPTMLHRIARLPEAERSSRDLDSLEFVLTSGSPCPPWLMETWIDWVGPDVMHESFGSTERVGGTFISGREWLDHRGSVGKPFAGSQARIVDPATGEEVPTGVMGEIYWMAPGGPGSSHDYIGADRRTTADGWESIGDMGYLDEDGYLYLGDRRSDMILSRGRNLYPAEIEAVLDRHPLVRSSVVIGLPDDDGDQRLHAIVEAEQVDPDELAAHVAEHLVRYKVPRSFEFVSTPLRDDSGKVRRTELRRLRVEQASTVD